MRQPFGFLKNVNVGDVRDSLREGGLILVDLCVFECVWTVRDVAECAGGKNVNLCCSRCFPFSFIRQQEEISEPKN